MPRLKKGNWTPQAERVLRERYLKRDSLGRIRETPEQMLWRVAREIAQVDEQYGRSEKEILAQARQFYQLMVERLFLPNSPTLMNAGLKNNLQYSACFVLPVEDSIEGIFEAIKRAAIIHQSGGGTGFSFSRLRPAGSAVKTSGGVASGPVSFMKIFDAATEQVKQGGRRRGANMGILRVDHPEIEAFINCKLEGGITNFNISVGATDEFMEAVIKKKDYWLRAQPGWPKPGGGRYRGGEKIEKKSAEKIFNQIVAAAWRNGDPGMVWLDRINNSPANPVPSMGPIEATNPCLVGSSLVVTDRGLYSIKELVASQRPVKVLFEGSYYPVTGFWNRGQKPIWRLTTKNGLELEATADHRILTQRGWVALAELKPGEDQVVLQSRPGGFGSETRLPLNWEEIDPTRKLNLPQTWSEELGIVLGWLIGDGWLRDHPQEARVGFSFGAQDEAIKEKIETIMNHWYGRSIASIKRENKVWHLSYHSQPLVEFFKQLGVRPVKAAEKTVPESIFTAPKEAVRGFLQGLFSADGTVGYQREKKSKYLRLTSKSKRLLQQVQLLLLNWGIVSRIYDRRRPPRTCFSYSTKKGEERHYLSDGICFELNLSRKNMNLFLDQIGFLDQRHQEKLAQAKQIKSYRASFTDLVVQVEEVGRKETVYDLSVPGANAFLANGLVVHNCGEQPLYPNEACNLGSINLSLMVKSKGKKVEIDWDKLEQVVRQAVHFLDNVIDINPFPLKEIRQAVLANRRIGLGVMGWADLLFQLRLPYDSRRGVSLAGKVMKFINQVAWDQSEKLAQWKGAFPNFSRSIYRRGRPKRNATVTTIAPTGSISIIANCSSGIEPVFALAFTHQTGERTLHFVNPHFRRALAELKSRAAILKQVKEQGHLADLDQVPRDWRAVFKTAHEIDYRWHIKMQAAFQQYVDNAVSKTINLPNSATKEDVAQAYLLAYRLGCRGITVFRDGCREEQVLTAGVKSEEKKTDFVVKPRPTVVKGTTYRINTPVGTAFVTVNHNGETDQPLEVFINVGKAGSDVAADAEAMGRLISLCLRISAPGLSPKKVAELIIDQLEGIGGGGSVGFGKERVRSLADGIAKVLKKHLAGNGDSSVEIIGQQPSLVARQKQRDLCPSCGNATLVLEEGCAKCASCGFSKC